MLFLDKSRRAELPHWVFRDTRVLCLDNRHGYTNTIHRLMVGFKHNSFPTLEMRTPRMRGVFCDMSVTFWTSSSPFSSLDMALLTGWFLRKRGVGRI